jgi:hypothetical protein
MLKGQLSFSTMGLALIAAVLGVYAASHPPRYPSIATASATLRWDAPAQPNPIYCERGLGGQYSNVHHGWVCSTELAPQSMK